MVSTLGLRHAPRPAPPDALARIVRNRGHVPRAVAVVPTGRACNQGQALDRIAGQRDGCSDFQLRELFNPDGQGGRRGDAFLDLAWTCGGFLDKHDARFPERYIAHVSDDAWNTRWGIIIDVEQDQLQFSIRSDDFLPPPSANDANTGDMITIRPVTHLRMHKSRAEPIRQAWNNAALWPPQKQNFCMDGASIRLEACIQGRYAMRSRTCDRDAQQAADTLRTAFKALLPTPEPVHQRPAPGTTS